MAEGATTTSYQDSFAAAAEKLCTQFGATDDDLAYFFDVCARTINRWKNRHPDFAAALKVGKEVADERVERSLYMRATGFRAPTVKVMQHQGVPIEVEYDKFYPPEVNACIFWLCNRTKGRYTNAHMRGGRPGSDDDELPEKIIVEVIDARKKPQPEPDDGTTSEADQAAG